MDDKNYLMLKEYSINEVRCYFTKKAYEELLSLNINNIGDLIKQDINGELVKKFYKRHPDAHELWNNIHQTIDLLKYKYLMIPLDINFDDKYDYVSKMGFSRTIRKRLVSNRHLSLTNIFKMLARGDYSHLYYDFNEERVSEIISKFAVVKDYLEKKDSDIDYDEFKRLYYILSNLVDEDKRIREEINIITKRINKFFVNDKKDESFENKSRNR